MPCTRAATAADDYSAGASGRDTAPAQTDPPILKERGRRPFRHPYRADPRPNSPEQTSVTAFAAAPPARWPVDIFIPIRRSCPVRVRDN